MAHGAPQLLTLQEAAERLNVHYMTAYRWVRRGDLPAFKTGGRLRIRTEDLEQFLEERQLDVAGAARPSGQTDWERHVGRLTRLLIDGDTPGAWREVSKVISDGATAGNTYVRLLLPAVLEVSDRADAGLISAAVDHRSQQSVRTMVGRLSDMFRRRGPSRGSAVCLMQPGEIHAILSAMLADILRAAGYEVHHLGCGLSSGDLAEFLHDVPADVVSVGVFRWLAPPDYGELAKASREAGDGVVVAFAGPGADEPAASAVDALAVREVQRLPALLAAV
jgi:excisionase family DNA binding protein